MNIQEAEKIGYMHAKSRKLLGAWYMHCKLTKRLYVGINGSRRYSYIETDTWNTPYNFSELGRSRLKDIITPYEEKKFAGLKKGASWSLGNTIAFFNGFPKEDAPAIAEKIIEVWDMDDSKEEYRTGLLMEGE